MKDRVKNRSASVRSRLTRLARLQQCDVDRVFLQYMQERLLYRVAHSRYRNRFVLKGGLLIAALHGPRTRPTKDIDLLARHLHSDESEMTQVFREIASIAEDDGVTFDPCSVCVERIAEQARYSGMRVRLDCFLEQAHKTLQIDIGFEDIVFPRPVSMDYPSILDDEPSRIWTYTLESVIAEKFEAMLRFSHINSRFKDFYDVYWLSLNHGFDGRTLQEAVFETTSRRATPLERQPAVFDPEFAGDTGRARQ
ncbi:MAG: nucleotidyl transferase AbiEii/AbiGii toxin family protein [Ignavibacteriales bacterium]